MKRQAIRLVAEDEFEEGVHRDLVTVLVDAVGPLFAGTLVAIPRDVQDAKQDAIREVGVLSRRLRREDEVSVVDAFGGRGLDAGSPSTPLPRLSFSRSV